MGGREQIQVFPFMEEGKKKKKIELFWGFFGSTAAMSVLWALCAAGACNPAGCPAAVSGEVKRG